MTLKGIFKRLDKLNMNSPISKNQNSVVDVINLTKYYGSKLAIENLNFFLYPNEIVGLLGLNGSGKTTTLRILSNYLFPTNGEIIINGMNLFENYLEIKKKIGYLPETPPLYEDFTVYEYLQFVSRIKGIRNTEIDSEIERVCKQTNLKDVKNKVISHLSLGFKKRVGIAMAIIGSPNLIILDEPISGLDPKQIVEIRNLIRQLSNHHTIIISSHILSEMVKTCNRFLFLMDGKIVKQLTLPELEMEMQKLSKLEICISGKNRIECLDYLKKLEPNTSIDFIHEDLDGFTFHVNPTNDKKFKSDLTSSLSANGLNLESLKRIEITLEQVFLSIIK